jgi:hypothetical protein
MHRSCAIPKTHEIPLKGALQITQRSKDGCWNAIKEQVTFLA